MPRLSRNTGTRPDTGDTRIDIEMRNGMIIRDTTAAKWRWRPWDWGQSDWDITRWQRSDQQPIEMDQAA